MKRLLLLILTIYTRLAFAQDATLIYKNTVNSTVTIETPDGLGSGFFVGENIIATNYHVIKGDTIAYCYTNNSDTKYSIEGYVAVDTSVDLILLKVSGLKRTPIRLSTTPVQIGQKIYVLGSPKGLPATISDGIVSAFRNFEGHKFIQITAPISHGSSGGPVMNVNGEIIGIAAAQLIEGQSLNFAIPKSDLVPLLKNKKTVPIPLSALNEGKSDIENAKRYYIQGNYTQAFLWFKNAAEQGESEAQLDVGKMYYAGQGVTQDFNQALYWYGKAANTGNTEAQYNLGDMYYLGKGISTDYYQAMIWFRKAADKGDADAQCDIGNMYGSGEGVTKDYHLAIEWYKKAAFQEDSRAEFELGDMYYLGQGSNKDYNKAIELFKKAAEKGFVEAQYFIGLMYEDGDGVKQDYSQAKQWYKKATENGWPDLQKKIDNFPNK